jgi:hypothetical protein
VKLNAMETAVLLAMGESNDSNGGDFGLVEDVKIPGLTGKQIGGYVTILQKKGLVQVHPPTPVNDYYVTQFDITKKGLAELKKAKK